MSTHNIGFYEEISKIVFQLSSNTHLISSCVNMSKFLIAYNIHKQDFDHRKFVNIQKV